MTINSKYFDSIRIHSRKKTAGGQDAPKCNWTGCEKLGHHRAPAGREREGKFFRFCIIHVREYNKNFNYFNGLSNKEIEKLQKEAVTGHLPTWKSSTIDERKTRAAQQFSAFRSGSASYQNRSRSVFDLQNRHGHIRKIHQRKVKTLEARAFSHLGLKETASATEIRAQYKALVKLHHPDSNGGDRSTEDRFSEILQAYNLLRKSGFC